MSENLGITDVFGIENAHFSTLTDSVVFVNEANHAAHVVIDEDGCMATAFTAMIYFGASLPPNALTRSAAFPCLKITSTTCAAPYRP